MPAVRPAPGARAALVRTTRPRAATPRSISPSSTQATDSRIPRDGRASGMKSVPGEKTTPARGTSTTRAVPGVHKAVKYNSPLYDIEGEGWFLGLHVFTNYVKVAFFRGASLRPIPPGTSKQKEVRYLDIHEDDQLDEAQFAAWVKQASKLPGENL